ncbi:MAG: hypothetical protein H7Y43_16095 [Akkermansiaceae bacterium]|nr:hypothetical protein [Verrucomicrobiales bacterium]
MSVNGSGRYRAIHHAQPDRHRCAICGLLLVAFVTGVGIFLFQSRKAIRIPTVASPFANVAESDIPGRYKYTSSTEENFITLYDDHSLKNKDGTILPVHRWELTPEGLVIHWKNNDTIYDQIEAPGIYTGPKTDGSRRRLEKQTDVDPAELVKPSPRPPPEMLTEALPLTTKPVGDVIASIRFGSEGETNKLVPRNTGGGDGQVFDHNLGGVGCVQLLRKPAKPECYLYLRIDPELKTAPFERAMVLVEYFDAAPMDARGAIKIQYDGPASAYQSARRRIPLTGTQTWKEAWFVLDAPVFQNRQNAQGDFRLAVDAPELYVRSVKLLNNLRPEQ